MSLYSLTCGVHIRPRLHDHTLLVLCQAKNAAQWRRARAEERVDSRLAMV